MPGSTFRLSRTCSYTPPSFSTLSVWPGFVDALSAFLLVLLLLLLTFLAINVELKESLDSSNAQRTNLSVRLEELNNELETLKRRFEQAQESFATSDAEKNLEIRQTVHNLREQEEERKNLEEKFYSRGVELSSVRQQLQAAEEALHAFKDKQKKDVEGYRSDFLTQLKKLLENDQTFQISGDRFVVQSEVFFPSGSSALSKEGQNKLEILARVLLKLSEKIPDTVSWVLRIDGHTDRVPVRQGARFSSNLELSFERASAVVSFLKTQGIPEKRLLPVGFSSHYPIVKGKTEKSYARNRRIEFKLDQR